MNLSCIIVDDEPLAIRLLENFIERTPFLTLKASFTEVVSEKVCKPIFFLSLYLETLK